MATAVKSLLGTLVKYQPHYLAILTKPYNYEEIFNMQQQWLGILQFTKKSGTMKDQYQQYISSLITIQDETIVFQERVEYFLIPSAITPVISNPTWKKNSTIIKPTDIPPQIFKLLAKKHESDTIYSSHPC